MKKLFKLGVITGLTCLGVSAFSNTKVLADSNKVLNWSEVSELQTLDTTTAVDVVSSEIQRNSYEGLYRLADSGKVEKGLVKTAKLSQDGLTYTFTLQKDAKWSNGDKVTAQDFVYSWQRAVDPKTKASNSQLFNGIKNADEITKGTKSPTELGVKAKNSSTLEVTLENKIPYFKSLVAAPVFFPLNKKVVTKYGDKYGTQAKYAVYNGPYTVTNWDGSSQKWTLVKNNKYWDKKHVSLDKINFLVTKSPTTSYNLYQTNKLDETNLSTEQAREMKKNKEFVPRKQARITYLQFNEQGKYLSNANLRKALSYSIDRKQLVNNVLDDGSTIARSFVPKDLMDVDGKDFSKLAASNQGTSYNKKLAQKYLDKALNELGQKKIELTLLGDDDDLSKKVNEFLQAQVEKTLGSKKLELSVQNINKKTRIARMQSGDFDLVQTGWGADYQDAASFLDLFKSNSSYNFGKWNSSEYDKLLATASGQSGQKRVETLKDANDLLLKEQVIAPLFQPAASTLVKAKVKGVVFSGLGGYGFKHASLK